MKYWWLLGLHEGKITLVGPYNSKEEAESVGMIKFTEDWEAEDWEAVELPTRNENEASRRLKRMSGEISNPILSQALENARRYKDYSALGGE